MTQEFLTWEKDDQKSMQEAFAKAYNGAIENNKRFKKTRSSDIYKNISPNTSISDGYGFRDYYSFRPDEAPPFKRKDVIKSSDNAYENISIIHNILNLMADFTIQGIKLVHKNPKAQEAYKQWWSIINGSERSERFVQSLLKTACAIVQRTTAVIDATDLKLLRQSLLSESDVEVSLDDKIGTNEIPWKYTFIDPLCVELESDDLAVMTGQATYGMEIPKKLLARIKNPTSPSDIEIVKKIPAKIVNLVRSGATTIPLDSEKVSVFHYRKDDWRAWGIPILAPVMPDLIMLTKMKLADMSALDGAISQIRLWRIGSLEHRILPNPGIIDKLSEILMNRVGGGVMDLVWGPDLDFKESSTEVYKFLGDAKYKPVLSAIYNGLGIPSALTGDSESTGTTNNYISLKTLLERLKYLRNILVEFWEKEIILFQRALGLARPAKIIFDNMTLSDENAEKSLMIQLADRGFISVETIQERFGEIPELEKVRVRRENRRRANKQDPPIAGPWYNPQHKESLEKIALQNGYVTPDQLGLELPDPKGGVKPPYLAGKDEVVDPQKGEPGDGRPLNKKDSKKRKQKEFTPQSVSHFMGYYSWAREAQEKISEVLDPMILESFGKKNFRQLSDNEASQAETLKTACLFKLPPLTVLSKDSVINIVGETEELKIPKEVSEIINYTIGKFVEKNSREPSLAEVRQFYANIFALLKGDY